MSVKASVSISNQQDSFARKLVEEGRYASLSAVVQRGLELVREETELKDAELGVLKILLDRRAEGKFVTMEESHRRVEAMIAAKRKAYGL